MPLDDAVRVSGLRALEDRKWSMLFIACLNRDNLHSGWGFPVTVRLFLGQFMNECLEIAADGV